MHSCGVSAEKRRVRRTVRQEKGNLLEGKERVTGPYEIIAHALLYEVQYAGEIEF